MYNPGHFSQHDRNPAIELMRSHPFATLVTQTDLGLAADHIPLIPHEDESGTLRLKGHVARANPLSREAEGQSVLAIFHGPQAYISPSAYPTKQQHGKVVPTWNYVAVHASGTINFIDEGRWKLEFLNQLTDANEADQPKPWTVADAPTEFTDKLLNAIVGFEILIESVQGKWKLSQNQPPDNIAGVISTLTSSDDEQAHAVAQLMENSILK